ncbi:MAG: outer membrane beta-barrel protein [Nitrospiraceae bacterium]|nr:outer membrane beta-barrel protein [Nitrospiraceae bacterium]
MISVRSRIGIGLGMCAMVSLLGGNAVFAQSPTPSTTERVAALETKTDAPGLWNTLGFKFSGAAEASYTQNFNNPNTNLNSLRIFDTQANSFVPQVAQFMVERPATAGSATDRIGFRARMNFGPQSRFSRARTNYQPGTDNTELDIHEIYAEYIVPIGNGLKIQAGKINTLIGLEVINSWENPNFSRSWTFGLAQAFTETGIRFTYPFASWATAAVGLINGWDNIEDNNRGKTVTWNLALTPAEVFGISFYGSYGSEQPNGNAEFGNAATGACINYAPGCDPTAKRTVVGSLITIKLTDSDTLIIEPYYGNEANASGASAAGNARWNAILAYYTHDFNDQTQPNAFSLRVRGEIFEDAGGARTCVGGNNFNGGANVCATNPGAGGFAPLVGTGGGLLYNGQTGSGVVQTLWEGTVTLQWKPAPSLMTRAEFRHDHSNKNVFLNGGNAANNQSTLGFSVVYLF